MTDVLKQRADLDTDTLIECHVKVKADVRMIHYQLAKELPRLTSKHQKLEKRPDFPFTALEGTNPGNTLISGSWSLELCDNTFLLFKPHGLRCFVTAALEH